MSTSGPSWGPLPPPPSGPPPAPVTGDGEPRNGTVVGVLLALLGGWTVALAVLGQFLAFGVDQVDPTKEHGVPWLLAALLLGLLAGIPAALVWRLSTHPRARAVGRAWAVAAALVVVVSPVRLLPAESSVLAMLVLAVAAAAAALVLSRLPAFATPRSRGDGGTLVAVAAGLLTLLPWAFYGALGGVVETLLAVLLAAAGGWLAAVVLAPVWREVAGSWRRSSVVTVGGLVAGVTCCLLFAGLSPRVSGLWLAVCVPPLGFVCAAASYAAPRRLPTLAGVGLAAIGPLAFLDPDEVNIILGFHDVVYAFLEMGLGVAAGLVGSGALAALARVLRSRRVAGLVACVALVGAGVLYAAGGQPGFDGDRLFVVLKQQAPVASLAGTKDLTARRTAVYDRLVSFADRTQRPLRDALGDIGVGYTPYYLVNALEVDAGPQLRPWLENRGDVAEVLDSPRLRPIRTLPPVDRGTGGAPSRPDWNLTMIRADEVWSKLHDRGAGVVVGQSDSGVDGTHPALAGSYRGRGGHDDDNWLDPWYGSSSPTDWGGHGTHTLGTAVGADNIGVAPGAQWIGCVNLGRNLADPPLYLTCMQFMLAPYPQHGDPLRDGDPSKAADVLNNSWGCPHSEGCDANVLRPAVDALTAAGIFVVASAGNDGPACGTIRDPISLYADSFTVGAVDASGNVAPFSSRGPVTADGSGRQKPDIAAPGVGVLSALPGGYGRLDGTSMAGPHVTGTVALMWSANPRLKGDVTRTAQILRSTAQGAALSKSGPNCGSEKDVVGAGILNAYAAVVAAKKVH